MKTMRIAVISGILAVVFIVSFSYFTSQVVAAPKMTLGEMRALLPADVRPSIHPANDGWKLAQDAADECRDRDVKPGSTLEFLDWKTPDDALVMRAEAYLKPKQEGFAKAAQAVTFSNWNYPFLPDSTVPTYQLFAQTFPVTAYLKGMAKQMVIKSRVDAFRHRPSEAVGA